MTSLFQNDLNFMVLDYKNVFRNQPKNFTKGCKWSPDGSCFVTADDQQHIRIFNTPLNAVKADFSDEEWFTNGWKNDIIPAVNVKEGEQIADYAWYPLMNSANPETCCFAVACRDMPVHLWDAWDGTMMCSYLTFDHLEQLVAPTSICFSTNGSHLVCGYKKELRIFATDRPGKQSYRVEQGGHSGIRSCIAFNPVLERLFAVGSYSGLIGLYCIDQRRNVGIFSGHEKGVTHIQFSDDGVKMYSGSRKESDIHCWDMRKPGTVLATYNREASNNQKIFFDLSPNGSRYLVSGSTSGDILVWDTHEITDSCIKNNPKVFKAHNDSTNGISLNPVYPLMLTSAGQRHHSQLGSPDTSDEDADTTPSECTIKLWSIGNV